MKKMLTLVCSIALCMGANAQVKQQRDMGSPRSQAVQMSEKSLIETSSKVFGKVEEVETADTFCVEARYKAEKPGLGFSWTGAKLEEINNRAAIYYTLGPGWASHVMGSGEIGYVFDFSADGWISSVVGADFSNRYITGAIVYMGRSKSTVASINDESMPFKFKLYTSAWGQLTRQQAFFCINAQGADDDPLLDVHYPADPEKFASESETIMIPWIKPEPDPSTGKTPRVVSKLYGARFQNPTVGGAFAGISFVFPHEDNAKDTLWNATMSYLTDGSDAMNPLMSERAGSVFLVIDFDRQEYWGTKADGSLRDRFAYATEEEPNVWMPDETAQPNPRYAVIPRQAMWWRNQSGARTEPQNEEPYFYIVISTKTDVERGASYDKYVEVKKNPAVGFTQIVATDAIQRVDIYNMNGKLMKTQMCNDLIETINLEGLNSGMYVAKVTTVAGIANKKIIVR